MHQSWQDAVLTNTEIWWRWLWRWICILEKSVDLFYCFAYGTSHFIGLTQQVGWYIFRFHGGDGVMFFILRRGHVQTLFPKPSDEGRRCTHSVSALLLVLSSGAHRKVLTTWSSRRPVTCGRTVSRCGRCSHTASNRGQRSPANRQVSICSCALQIRVCAMCFCFLLWL